MRRVILILVASAVVIALAWFLAGLPGQVSAEIGTVTFEAATPVVLLGLLALFVVLYVLLRLLGALIGAPRTLRRWRLERHRHAGEIAVGRALIALAAGGGADARRQAQRARQLLGDTPQTLLLAAEAGRLAGREDEAANAFRLLADRQDGAFLGLRGLLRQAIGREEWAEAAALARQAEAAYPGAAWVRQERAQLAVRAGNWAEALELATDDAPRAALGAAAAEAETDAAKARRMARDAWRKDPTLSHAALAYARRLRAAGQESRAGGVISDAWKAAPHPDLAAFLLEPVTDKLARAQAAQRLTAATPDHPESRMLLARTALDAGLTGEARHHLEAAQKSGLNQQRLWLLLAELEEEERGDSEEGRRAQRDALRRAAAADADPGWLCTSCHTPQPAWAAACPACATAGGLRWTGRNGPVAAAVPMTLQGD